MPQQVEIAKHTIQVEECVMIIVLRGDLELDDMQRFLAIADAVVDRHGGYAAIVDVRQLGSLTPAARIAAKNWQRSNTCLGNWFIGASFATRTMLTLIVRGLQLFTARPLHAEFCKTEAEARSRLSSRLRRHAAPL